VISVDPAEPEEAAIEIAVGVLRRGGIVATPTETVYGLAVDCRNRAALALVNRLKRKAEDANVLLLLGATEQVAQVAARIPPRFHALASRFWPGPLTLVVPAAAGSVAVRVPGLALPRRLATRLGAPISGISANVSGQPPCRSASDIARIFGDGVELIFDGGTTAGDVPSTILDLTCDPPRVVREGVLPLAVLEPFLAPL
jgi:L-threonylcarbamoyladenylate synthase